MRIGRGPLVALALAVVLVAVAVGLPFIVKGLAQRQAAGRGFDLQADTVALGFGRVNFGGVRLTTSRLPSLQVKLARLSIGVGLSGVGDVRVSGGNIDYVGGLSELRDKLSPSSGASGEARRAGARRRIEVERLNVDWTTPQQTAVHLSNLSVIRDEGEVSGRLEEGQLRADGAEVRVEGVGFAADLSKRTLRTLTARNTFIELQPQVLLRGFKAVAVAPTGAPGPPGGQAKSDASAGKVSPPAPKTWMQRWTVDESRGARFAAAFNELVTGLAERLPEGAGWKLERIHSVLRFDDNALSVGPARLVLEKRPSSIFLELVPGYQASETKRLEIEAELPLAGGDLLVNVRGGPIALGSLGVKPGDLGLTAPEATRLTVAAQVRWPKGSDEVHLQTHGELDKVSVSHRGLADYPLTGMSLAWNADGVLALSGKHLHVARSTLSLGAVGIEVEGELFREPDRLKVSGKAGIPTASCQDMFDSLPDGLAPGLSGARLSGTFSWRGEADFDTDLLSDMRVLWRMQNRCRFVSVPKEVDPRRFKHPFRLSVPDELGQAMSFRTGPGSSNWVPLPDISKYLETAVLVTEDGRFWSHGGFDQGAIQSAIRQNINAGRYVRGASTITMQLAKNLYLSRSKVLARKVEEALLTMLIEQELRKDQILELYLNVIEYAPGIYGAQQAAEYYFRSLPEELSVAQSFFLASMLPAPSRQRFADTGALREGWAKYVRSLMRIAQKRDRIDADELARGLSETLRFGTRYEPPGGPRAPQEDVDTF